MNVERIKKRKSSLEIDGRNEPVVQMFLKHWRHLRKTQYTIKQVCHNLKLLENYFKIHNNWHFGNKSEIMVIYVHVSGREVMSFNLTPRSTVSMTNTALGDQYGSRKQCQKCIFVLKTPLKQSIVAPIPLENHIFHFSNKTSIAILRLAKLHERVYPYDISFRSICWNRIFTLRCIREV